MQSHEQQKDQLEQTLNQGVNFVREPKLGPLVMGKPKKALETSLDFAEQKILKEAIAQQCKLYKQKVTEKYHDNFASSIMMSPESNQVKNEILRKIQYMKMKKTKLANFIRLKRNDLLQQRDINQRQLLINQSEASFMSIAQHPENMQLLPVTKGIDDKHNLSKQTNRTNKTAKNLTQGGADNSEASTEGGVTPRPPNQRASGLSTAQAS